MTPETHAIEYLMDFIEEEEERKQLQDDDELDDLDDLITILLLLVLLDILDEDVDIPLFKFGPGKGNGQRLPQFDYRSRNRYHESTLW